MKRGLLVGGIVALIAGALGWVLWFSPLLSLQTVVVTISPAPAAAGPLDEAQISAQVQTPTGTPLVRVDTTAIEQRIEELPQVASARVNRSWPRSLTIDVERRVAVAALAAADGGFDIVAADGVVIRHAADRGDVPVVSATGDGAPAALAVASGLPEWLDRQTALITASTRNDVLLQMDSGALVVWGNDQQGELKAQVLQRLLLVPAGRYDVSAPEVPATSDDTGPLPTAFPATPPAPSVQPSSSTTP